MVRLNEQRGETLMESLGAILIFTFSSVALFTMLNTANVMNQMAQEADDARQTGKILAETREGAAAPGQITLHLNGKREVFAVDVMGDRERGYVFYLAEAAE